MNNQINVNILDYSQARIDNRDYIGEVQFNLLNSYLSGYTAILEATKQNEIKFKQEHEDLILFTVLVNCALILPILALLLLESNVNLKLHKKINLFFEIPYSVSIKYQANSDNFKKYLTVPL